MGNTYKKKVKAPKKVTDKELEKLQSIVKALNNLSMEIGKMEISKFRATANFNGLENQLTEYQVELKETYGDVVVNLQTGELKPAEDGKVN